jgi:hypothetical protein
MDIPFKKNNFSRPLTMADIMGGDDCQSKNYNQRSERINNDQREYSHTKKLKP